MYRVSVLAQPASNQASFPLAVIFYAFVAYLFLRRLKT
jgi:hypothetical protein